MGEHLNFCSGWTFLIRYYLKLSGNSAMKSRLRENTVYMGTLKSE